MAGPSASWSQTVGAAGNYQISAWIVTASGSDPNAVYTVMKNGVTVATVNVDQTSGSSRWVTLAGNLVLAANDGIKITIKASGTGCTRSDTVKLVRIA